MEKQLKEFFKKAKKIKEFSKIDGVMLYGSYLENKNFHDIDLCIFYTATKKEMFDLRKKLLGISHEKFDIQIFGLLPLYVQINVLKGKLIFYNNYHNVYGEAVKTIKDYRFFETRYLDYISKKGAFQ
jgi:uncharacterized protein